MKRISDKINTTTVTLAVTCVILLVALIVAVAYWDSSNSAYINLQSQNSAYVDDHSHTNEEFESLKSNFENAETQLSTSNNQSTVSKLQNQVNNLTSIVNLWNIITLVSNKTLNLNANGNSQFQFTANYSGYITVTLFNPNPVKNWYVETTYSFEGLSYNTTVMLSPAYGYNSMQAGFSILGSPVSSNPIQIIVGNTNPSSGATATAEITYTY
jgi:hypothetical protein